MFIGHLPGAYLALKLFERRLPRAVYGWALVGSVLPDIDMLAFYFWHDRAFHHHEYLTHRPVFWLFVCICGVVLSRRCSFGFPLIGLGIGGLIHMCLDSIVGAISWLWPYSDVAKPLVIVPATQSHWILSFLLHWTFAVELAVCAIAGLIFLRSRAANAP